MRASRSRATSYSVALSLCMGQFLLAMMLSRQSCDWSLPAYVIAGIIVMGSMMMLPYLMRRAYSRHSRTPMALAFGVLGLVGWLVGLGLVFGAACGSGT